MRLILDARTAAFAALVDYAGLFPPASLDMAGAVEGYRAARSSDARWVAGRFLCPASRLEELAGVLTTTFIDGEDPWEIGVVLDTEPGEGASAAQTFHVEMQPAAIIASAEARPLDAAPASIAALVDTLVSIQPEVVPFVEVAASEPLKDQISTVAQALGELGRVGGVKIRCGGTVASMFPEPGTVASFILEATNAKLPYKATAGLHQPIRHYDSDLGVWRHGFVNLLVAAAAAEAGHGVEKLTTIVADTDPDAFAISTAFATWRDLSIPGPAMRRVRTQGFVAYGSCDFFEPIEALEGLSFLGGST
ncbi:MAG: hypothetical protein ABFR53_12525 [Actinomycetota bacterium]